MMECSSARAQILTAGIADLRGAGDSELAQHVRECASCQARAELILAEYAALDHALGVLSTRPVAARPTASSQRATSATTPAQMRQLLPRVLLPLAAAAALTLVVLQNMPRESQSLPPILLPAERVADVPIVNAPAGRNVAVMRTNDPRITVVWYY